MFCFLKIQIQIHISDKYTDKYSFIGLLSKKIENVQERVSKQYWSHYFCNSIGDESGAEITHFTFE